MWNVSSRNGEIPLLYCRDPALPGRISHVIALARLCDLTKLFNTTWKPVPPCWDETWFTHVGSRKIALEENCPPTLKLILTLTQTLLGGNFPRGQLSGYLHIIVGWNLSRLDWFNFHSGQTESCNYHLKESKYILNSFIHCCDILA